MIHPTGRVFTNAPYYIDYDGNAYAVGIEGVGIVQSFVSRLDAERLCNSLPVPLTLQALLPLALQWRQMAEIQTWMVQHSRMVTLDSLDQRINTMLRYQRNLFTMTKGVLYPWRKKKPEDQV